MADLARLRQGAHAAVRVFWPRCWSHHTPGQRTVRCWRLLGHRSEHRYGAITWPRSKGPWARRARLVTGAFGYPFTLAALVFDAVRLWQEDRRTANRFGYPTPGEARRRRRAARRSEDQVHG